MTVRMMPPAVGNMTVKVPGGRIYSGTPGTPIDCNDADGGVLSANGWLSMGAVGGSAARPAVPFVGQIYNDTDVGGNVIWDGKHWRHHQSCAIV
jgi:hypothetical protein